MALNQTDKREIEKIVRQEIKSFLGSNTMNQFEKKMIDKVKSEIKSGRIKGDINELVTKIMREFYRFMWTQRATWEPRLRNVK
jgi:anti-sigma28 factor (negative regulator of flagellin synthesis)